MKRILKLLDTLIDRFLSIKTEFKKRDKLDQIETYKYRLCYIANVFYRIKRKI